MTEDEEVLRRFSSDPRTSKLSASFRRRTSMTSEI
jgi:hypothetical protein